MKEIGRRIPGLDELRGLATIAVMTAHFIIFFKVPWPYRHWHYAIGAAFVDMFFMISGCLVTDILLADGGRVAAIPQYYVRRVLRILPLAYIVIALSYFCYPETRYLWPAYVFFYVNYSMKRGITMGGVGNLWSLSVEEHFYIVYPWIVALFTPRRLWIAIAALGCLFFTLHATSMRPTLDGLYTADGHTHTRAYYIAAGAWLALLNAGLVPRPALITSAMLALVAAGAVLSPSLGSLEVPLAAASITAIWLAITGRAALRQPLLRFLGVRCYSLYLLHPWVLAGMNAFTPWLSWSGRLVIYAAASILLSHITFTFLERPLYRIARGIPARFGAPATVVTAA